MFKTINHIDDVRPFVAHKKEIRFLKQPNDTTIGCYIFADNNTFDSREALECRGIAFDKAGNIISRPLHKFFNLGEREHLQSQHILARNDIVAIYDKLDGSMIATAFIDGVLHFRSRKAFDTHVVKLAHDYICEHEKRNIYKFCLKIASHGLTAIFELTHPDARIIVRQHCPELRLLHVRDNITGEYVMLNPNHEIHQLIADLDVPMVKRRDDLSLNDVLQSLDNMQEAEGYVVQFTNGDMIKIKCPWYTRLHRCVSHLRERDVALLALNNELDDIKGKLNEIGVDLAGVNEVEQRLKKIVVDYMDQIDAAYEDGKTMDRKTFAMTHQKSPVFGLMMQRYLGRDLSFNDWYIRNRLKQDFSLQRLTNETLNEAL